MTEIYKIVNSIASPVMNSLFEYRLNLYSLRNIKKISTVKRNTVNYGLETVTYRTHAI